MTTTLQTDRSTAAKLHAGAVEKYTQLVLAEFRGEQINASELKECLIILGLPAVAITQDVETLRRRERAFDAIEQHADSRSFSNPSSSAQHVAIEQERSYRRYIGEEAQRFDGLNALINGPGHAPISISRMGPTQPEWNPIEGPMRDLLATGDELAANHLRSRIAELRSAQRKHDEQEFLAAGVDWARDEATHLEKRIGELRAIAAEGDRIRAMLPGFEPDIDAAKGRLSAMKHEVVFDGATLAPAKEH